LIDSLRDQIKIVIDENRNLKNNPKVEYVERMVDRTDQTLVADLRNQISALESDKNRYLQRVAGFEVDLKAKDNILRDLDNKFNERQDSYSAEVESLKRALADRNMIIDRIIDLQKDQEKEISSLKDKLVNAERGLIEGQQSNRIESQRIEQLQAERNRYMIDCQQSDKRYKELQAELSDQQERIQDFYANQLKEKDRTIKSKLIEIEELQSKQKNDREQMQREMDKQWEMQRNTIMKEMAKTDNSKEVFWNKEREILKSQIENLTTKVSEQEKIMEKLRTEGINNQQKDSELDNLRYSNSNLKNEMNVLKSTVNELKLQNNDLFSRLEDKNTEIKELIVFKEKYETFKEDHSKLKSELNRRDEELVQFNSELITLKDRIKNLLKKIDEVSNEKLFYEAKVERLETRLMEVLYNEEKTKPNINDSMQLKDDIESNLKRS